MPSQFVRSGDLEGLDGTGRVFAVTWKGLNHPDLSKILGNYYSEYMDHHQETMRTKGIKISHLVTPKMVLQKGGHMRDVHGKAYVPDLLPEGVKPEELQ